MCVPVYSRVTKSWFLFVVVVDGFIAKSLLKDIFSARFCSNLKFQRKKSIGSCTVTIDHDSTEDGELTTGTHPVFVENIFQVLVQDVVHFEDEGCLFALRLRNLINVRHQKMLDTVHLVVMISTAEISAGFVTFGLRVCPDGSTTG